MLLCTTFLLFPCLDDKMMTSRIISATCTSITLSISHLNSFLYPSSLCNCCLYLYYLFLLTVILAWSQLLDRRGGGYYYQCSSTTSKSMSTAVLVDSLEQTVWSVVLFTQQHEGATSLTHPETCWCSSHTHTLALSNDLLVLLPYSTPQYTVRP